MLSYVGRRDFELTNVYCRLEEERRTSHQQEKTLSLTLKPGEVKEVGEFTIPLPNFYKKTETVFLKIIAKGTTNKTSNTFPVFIYPKYEKPEMKVAVCEGAEIFEDIAEVLDVVTFNAADAVPDCDAVLTHVLTSEILRFALGGGRVVLVQRGKGSLPVVRCSFWRDNILYRDYDSFMQNLESRSAFDDLRFFSVATDTALDFGALKEEFLIDYRPIVRRCDTKRHLAHDYMARIGYGKGVIYATTLRLEGGAGTQPAPITNNVIGNYILHGMLTENN